jgi:hypothetical protein
MKRLVVLLVLAASLALPLAAAYGGSSKAPSAPAPAAPAPAMEKPAGAHGDCPYASLDASV